MGTKKGSLNMYEGLALAFQENDSLTINFYLLKRSFVCLFVWLFSQKFDHFFGIWKNQSAKLHLHNILIHFVLN